jgi:hypothetical protein
MSGNSDPLFLQFKQVRRSVLEPCYGANTVGPSGKRVVAGQHILEAASDMFLGLTNGAGEGKRQFFIHQLSDAKIEPEIKNLKEANLRGFTRLCGMILARAHACSGDAAVLTGYMGKCIACKMPWLNSAWLRPIRMNATISSDLRTRSANGIF